MRINWHVVAALAAVIAGLAVIAPEALAALVPAVVVLPPGGGEVVQGTFRIGPFNLAPEGQPGDESNTARCRQRADADVAVAQRLFGG